MSNSKKKLEAEISAAFIKFQRELIGRGPREAKTYIINDMLITRFKGVLTVEEKHLVNRNSGKNLSNKCGSCFVKCTAKIMKNLLNIIPAVKFFPLIVILVQKLGRESRFLLWIKT